MIPDPLQRPHSPYLLDLDALANAFALHLNAVLTPLLQAGRLDINTALPSEYERLACAQHNLTLYAQLQIRWEHAEQPLTLDCPYPWHGVFFFAAEHAENAECFTWRPYLSARPGLWRVRQSPDELPVKRLVFIDGYYREYPAKKTKKNQKPKKSQLKLLASVLDSTQSGPKWLHIPATDDALQSIWAANADLPLYDAHDLAYQRLFTYEHFLFTRLLQCLYQWLENQHRAWGDTPPSSTEIWQHFIEPRHWCNWIPARSRLTTRGLLIPFKPINGIDALSQLCAVQKFAGKSDVLERKPPAERQNHPSFRGLICPVETPESARVGINLTLARGVTVDLRGHLYPSPNRDTPDTELGEAAALVPFFNHNDGARAMMGAKNLKQAVPIAGAQLPAIRTGTESQAWETLARWQHSSWLPAADQPVLGVDLLVAYMPFFGWNYEDAIVANRRLADEGLMDWVYERHHSRYLRPGFCPARRDHWPSFETPLDADDSVAWFRHQDATTDVPIPSEAEDGGYLLDCTYHQPPHPTLGGRLTWRIGYRRPLVIGDKLMGRYGNKGVISCLLPPERMPRLPDDPLLPPALRGRAVDLVLNPLGVISRMNLGQLIETQANLLRVLGQPGWWLDDARAGAYRPAGMHVDLDAMRQGFIAWGADQTTPIIDAEGRMRLEIPLPEGGHVWTEGPVAVGFQHIVRLRHHPPLKAQARAGRGPRDRYRTATGQPVAGRRQHGGQRIGEMEIWALAAYQAPENLRAILGYKSDPALPLPSERAPETSPNADTISSTPPLRQRQTFSSILDHFQALGIDIAPDPNNADAWQFKWIEDDELKETGQPITTAEVWKAVRVSEFRCSNSKCSYQLPIPIEATGKAKGSDIPSPTVSDLLRTVKHAKLGEHTEPLPSLDLKENFECTVAWPLLALDEQPAGTLNINIALTKTQLKIEWTLNDAQYSTYLQISKKTLTEITTQLLNDLPLTCPKHRDKKLIGSSVVQPKPVAGGLADPQCVGDVTVTTLHETAWSYIELPEAVSFPCWPKKTDKKDKKPTLMRSCIPVLPRRQRDQPADRWDREPLNAAYANLLAGKASNDIQQIKKSLEKITQLLEQRLTGKMGLIRRDGLGRRVDWSGRCVIAPDPNMPWDACGVPIAVLVVLLGRHIAHWPNRSQAIQALSVHAAENRQWLERLDSPDFWLDSKSLNRLQRDQSRLTVLRSILSAWLEQHPDTWVLLNRQPSLHRYSLMAFKPHPLPPEDGLVLRIHPLVCKGFGADFDGDEMALHLPLSQSEQDEAAHLAPTRQLLSVADGKPVAGFDQDFILGHALLSRTPAGRAELAAMLGQPACPACQDLWSQLSPWYDKHGIAVMQHLCRAHPELAAEHIPTWMQRCFRAATLAGVSFGILDAHACRLPEQKKPAVPVAPDTLEALAEVEKTWNQTLADAARDHLEQIAQPTAAHALASRPGAGLAMIALSGARGSKQLRQILAARGALLPGAVRFPLDAATCQHFLIPSNLLTGLSPDEVFWAAMNARSSLADKKLETPKAGNLTRRLVLALWGWKILQNDCGATAAPRTLLNCKCIKQNGFCAACYGATADAETAPLNWPVGLLAAQSIGERGTQLSMQSFHTGSRAMSIQNDVNPLLKLKSQADLQNVEDFIQAWRAVPPYKDLDERYLRLLWYVIDQSSGKTLESVWTQRRGSLSGLVGARQLAHVLNQLNNTATQSDDLPLTQILIGQITE